MPNTYGRQVVLALVNKSGGSVVAGDVVVIDTSNDTAFTTTTTASFGGVIGIAQETIANNATGRVLMSGYAALVNVPSSQTRGHYLFTHTVAKQAAGASSRASGAFGRFLTGGTTPVAHLFGITDGTAAGGGSVVPNVILNYTQSSDISGVALGNGTWTDVLANQNFTVANASSLVEISIRGLAFNNVVAGPQAVRAIIDSAGTPITENVSGYYMSSGLNGNFFAGSAPFFLSGLSAAVHTIKLQATSSNAVPGAFYCRPSGAPPEFLRIQIVEHLPA